MEDKFCPEFLVDVFVVVPFFFQICGPAVVNFCEFGLLAFGDNRLAVAFCGVRVGVGVQSGDDVTVVAFLYFLGDVAVVHGGEQLFEFFAFFGFACGEGFCGVGVFLFFSHIGDVGACLYFGKSGLCSSENLRFFFVAHVYGVSFIVCGCGSKYHTGDGGFSCLIVTDIGVGVFYHVFLHFGCQCIFFVDLHHIVFGSSALSENCSAGCIFRKSGGVFLTLCLFIFSQRCSCLLGMVIENDDLFDPGNNLLFRIILKCCCIAFLIRTHTHCPEILSKIGRIG